jgi:hypothetical protein
MIATRVFTPYDRRPKSEIRGRALVPGVLARKDTHRIWCFEVPPAINRTLRQPVPLARHYRRATRTKEASVLFVR